MSLSEIPSSTPSMLDEQTTDELAHDLHQHQQHQQQQQLLLQQQRQINIILPPEEFAEDLELRLGRANGNIYYRKAGVEGIHDGQVMVRLKKKRFVILDYSLIPTEDDIQYSNLNQHITCPEGAGKRQCVTPGCTKVGVPVLLYDSDPTEPTSLYLRSGLCFTCQRNLNEKRRTQRKRKSDVLENGGVDEPINSAGAILDSTHNVVSPHRGGNASGVFTIASDQKKLKLNGNVVHLAPDAIIVNGAVNGARHHCEGYSFHEIGIDLSHMVQESVHETQRLLHAVSPSSAAATVAVASFSAATNSVTPLVMSSDASAILSNLGDDGLTSGNVLENGLGHHHHHLHNSILLHGGDHVADNEQSLSSEDIAAMYEKAFLSLSKSLFLLSQWKSAWDAEVAAAVAQETVHDACLADAVASAAAVVAAAGTSDLPPLVNSNSGDLLAAAAVGVLGGSGGGSSSSGELQHCSITTSSCITNSSSTNMVSLILAAEQKGDDNAVVMKGVVEELEVDDCVDDVGDIVMERNSHHHHHQQQQQLHQYQHHVPVDDSNINRGGGENVQTYEV